MRIGWTRAAVAAALLVTTSLSAYAEIIVGVNISLTGPVASVGIPNQQGISLGPREIEGEPVRYIFLDDGSDPTKAVQNTRRLIVEDKADIVIGYSSTPAAIAGSTAAVELGVPVVAISPFPATPEQARWAATVIPDSPVWIAPIIKRIAKTTAPKVAFIGFSDAWGDISLAALKEGAAAANISLVAEERYARADTSVVAQVLKATAAAPSAIFVGASGTPGALPHLTLSERGWAGPQYNTPAVVSSDFIRVGGAAVEGVMATSGLFQAGDSLPDGTPSKKPGKELREKFAAKFPGKPLNALVANAYDVVLVAGAVLNQAAKSAKPGTPAFREAARQALHSGTDFVGAQAIYNYPATSIYGVDERGIALYRVEKGDWKVIH